MSRNPKSRRYMTILTSFTSQEKWQQIANVIISLRKSK